MMGGFLRACFLLSACVHARVRTCACACMLACVRLSVRGWCVHVRACASIRVGGCTWHLLSGARLKDIAVDIDRLLCADFGFTLGIPRDKSQSIACLCFFRVCVWLSNSSVSFLK